MSADGENDNMMCCDEILFKQPESSHLGDCPICLVPLSLDENKSTLYTCCSKLVCDGCNYANRTRQIEGSLDRRCPFCRHPTPKADEEIKVNRMNRIEANDPEALCDMGKIRYHERDYMSAFDYWTKAKAAELGNIEARYLQSIMYLEGNGVEKDKNKEVYHLEQAAIRGHPLARHNLGSAEWDNGRHDRAVKHWVIAARLGYARSMNALVLCYREGSVGKEDFAAALRAHQAAVDATKSPQSPGDFGSQYIFRKLRSLLVRKTNKFGLLRESLLTNLLVNAYSHERVRIC